MESVYSCLERKRSVSSMRRWKWPPKWRASSQQKMAVRAPPMCRCPVGLGAKRVTTFMVNYGHMVPEGKCALLLCLKYCEGQRAPCGAIGCAQSCATWYCQGGFVPAFAPLCNAGNKASQRAFLRLEREGKYLSDRAFGIFGNPQTSLQGYYPCPYTSRAPLPLIAS